MQKTTTNQNSVEPNPNGHIYKTLPMPKAQQTFWKSAQKDYKSS